MNEVDNLIANYELGMTLICTSNKSPCLSK